MGDLVAKISRIMEHQVTIASDEQRLRPAKSEVDRLLSNPGRMYALTGWSAQVGLDEGLRRTVDWMKARRSLYKSHLYNV